MRVSHAHALCLTRMGRIEHLEKVHSQDTVVVCTHGGCMMVLHRALTGVCQTLPRNFGFRAHWLLRISPQMHPSHPPAPAVFSPRSPSYWFFCCKARNGRNTLSFPFLASVAACGYPTTVDGELKLAAFRRFVPVFSQHMKNNIELLILMPSHRWVADAMFCDRPKE